MAKVFVTLAAVRHFGKRADPVDQTSVRHTTVPDNTARTCRQMRGSVQTSIHSSNMFY